MSIKKTWKHKIKLNIIGASLYFVGQLPAIFAPKGNFLLMMLSLFGGAIIFPLTVSTYLAIIQNVVPKDKIGRVMSLDHMISMAIAPIGALLAGPLVELIGIVNLFFICALIGIVFPYFIWFFTKIRQLEIIDQEKMTESEKAVEDSDVPKLIEVAQISEPIE
jgi:MFS family permease